MRKIMATLLLIGFFFNLAPYPSLKRLYPSGQSHYCCCSALLDFFFPLVLGRLEYFSKRADCVSCASTKIIFFSLFLTHTLLLLQMLIPPNQTRSLSLRMSPSFMTSSPIRLLATRSSTQNPRRNSNNFATWHPHSTSGFENTSASCRIETSLIL